MLTPQSTPHAKKWLRHYLALPTRHPIFGKIYHIDKKEIRFVYYQKKYYFCTHKLVKMKRQRIYIDTSIVGGFFDKEFEKETKMLFQRLENKDIIFVISDLLFKELENAPPNVKYLLDNYDKNFLEEVVATDEVSELADKYIAEKVVGRTSLDDCKHIALATINKVDVLASWNFKHIVNLERIKGYNGVNLKMGYSTIEIRNPKDLVYYGERI